MDLFSVFHLESDVNRRSQPPLRPYEGRMSTWGDLELTGDARNSATGQGRDARDFLWIQLSLHGVLGRR